MKFGAVFPHKTIEPDAGAIRAYVRSVEEMGFTHILSYDHVIGANAASRPGWKGYDLDSKFHEPIALLSFIAGMSEKIGLATGVMILPQRQTVLVAKQAATLDVLSGGRLRLGIGTGWNHVEYEALGRNFKDRGRMFDEQIDVLRQLWTERAVTVATDRHTITDAGIYPLPVQSPIPLWLGGGGVHPITGWAHVDKVLHRIATKADGWLPTFDPDEEGAGVVEKFREIARDVGRDLSGFGIEALLLASRDRDWITHIRAWEGLGATHICCSSMVDDVAGVDGNLERLAEVRASLVEAGLWQQ